MKDRQLRLVGTMIGEPWAAATDHGLNPLNQTDRSLVSAESGQSESEFWLRRLPPVEINSVVTGPVVTGPVVTGPVVQPMELFGFDSDIPPVILLPPQPAESIPAMPEKSSEPSWSHLSDADAALFTGVWTGAKNHDVALAKIQHGYLLADRHAYYAARQEFIQVLRMVSRTADAREQTTERTADLASGLRALEEAEDFAPPGTRLEADMNVAIIASAHRTAVARDPRLQQLQPRQLMDRYFRFAQLKLAAAVAGDPDGSMALHALGKLQRRLSRMEPKEHPLAHRQAFAFQQAALLAHHYNHLAAHELGVLLADAGHYHEAVRLLEQVAIKEPHPVVLRNLAQVQYQLGRAGQAAANDRQADRLASQSGVQGSKVRWVSPQEFARAADVTTFGMPVKSRTNSVQPLAGGVRASMTPSIDASSPKGQPPLGRQQPARNSRVPNSKSHPSYLWGAQ